MDRNPLRRRIDRVEAGMLGGDRACAGVHVLPGRPPPAMAVRAAPPRLLAQGMASPGTTLDRATLTPGTLTLLESRAFAAAGALSRVRAQVSLPLGVAVVLGADEAPVRSFRDSGRNRESPAEFG